MKHRKLFPASTPDQSLVCPDVCGSRCQYNCFPYSDTYAVPSAPPPPPPPWPRPPSTHHAQSVSPYIIIIASFLGAAFLILIYYLLIVKNCAGLERFRPRRRQQQQGTEEDLVVENRGPAAIDHPIWYIRTVGLQPSIINSIAVFKYKKDDRLIEGTDCSICLNEFQDQEILRLLPKCNHAFHIPCIDTWLRSHTNCPVCRSAIIIPCITPPVAPNGSYYNNSTRDENTRVQDTGGTTTDGGFSRNQARNSELERNGIRTREEIEFPGAGVDVQAVALNTAVNFDEDPASWVIDENSDENNMVQDHEIEQMMKRSISADSLLVAKLEDSSVIRNGDAHKCEPSERNISKSKRHTIDYDGANTSSRPGSVSMKRSLSSGSKSFFSRHTRSLSSILPL